MRGALRSTALKESQKLPYVDDMKMRASLLALQDRYAENIRDFILLCYKHPGLLQTYKDIRNSGIYEKGKDRRKIVEFPNPYVFDYCDTILTALYDEDWLNNTKALNHEIVKPWLVVNKI